MKIKAGLFALALVFTPSVLVTSASEAAVINLPQVEVEGLAINVHRCHRGVRGNRYPHFHKRGSCRKVRVQRDDDDDDDDDDFDRDDDSGDGEACLRVGGVVLCN